MSGYETGAVGMNGLNSMGEDTLGERLMSARPRASVVTREVEDELARMSVAAWTDTRAVRSAPKLSRIVGAGIATAVLIGGVGAAAASVVGWSMWAQEPDGSFAFTLPSGTICEGRIGGVEAEDPEIQEELSDWLSNVDLISVLAIDEAVTAVRADQERFAKEQAAQGVEYPMPDADQEYQLALSFAVEAAAYHELEERGYSLDRVAEAGLSFSTQTLSGDEVPE
jgi:hypothetical protein